MISKDLIQIAGIIDQAEADMLMRCGIRYLGFPLRLPVNKEDLSEPQAAEIIGSVKPPCRAVLITYLDQASEIIAFCHFLGTAVVQLHGAIEVAELQKIKRLQPQLVLMKSLVIGRYGTDTLLRTMECTAPYIDAYITDTFDPRTGASGATGKAHDWTISRRLVVESPRPVILAGGLNPDNVREAIMQVQPAGVDAHTGVEDDCGRKSELKVKKFIAAARDGFRLVHGNPV